MDEQLKDLIKQLGHAINESVSDSDAIAESIAKIKREGYDVYLVLQATIGFSRSTEDDAFESASVSAAGQEFTEQDTEFLKALKIKVEE